MWIVADNFSKKVAPLESRLDKIYIDAFSEGLPLFVQKWHSNLSMAPNTAIWGAGAKGTMFVNYVDNKNEKLIKAVVDINKNKQKRFIGKTGHVIISPEEIPNRGIKRIISANPNYTEEIRAMVDKTIEIVNL